VLQDEPHRRIVRIGDTVRRPAERWTPTVHALLRHLEAVGYPHAPRARGFDDEGREVLTFLDGESGQAGWAKVVDDSGLTAFARLLRDYHDAVAGFRPPADALWSTGTRGLAPDEVVCHGDFGPWNIVWQGPHPVGIIDWDHARPALRLHDMADALEYVAPFRDDSECLRWLRFPRPPDRRHRIEVFATAYGLGDTCGLVDAVIAVQRDGIELVRRLASEGRQPQAAWVAGGHLEQLERGLGWSRANRHLAE
jgi:hypothetical protein